MTVHTLTCGLAYFNDIATDRRTHEIRKDDRVLPFTAGDVLHLLEYDPQLKQYTGRVLNVMVLTVHRSSEVLGLAGGLVLMTIQRRGSVYTDTRLRGTDTRLGGSSQKLSHEDVTAATREIKRARTIITDTAAELDPECPDKDAYADGHCSLAETARAVVRSAADMRKRAEEQTLRADALQKFKDFVHRFLDDGGVPKDPYPGETQKHGCRIGGRLKWLLDQWKEAYAASVATSQAIDSQQTLRLRAEKAEKALAAVTKERDDVHRVLCDALAKMGPSIAATLNEPVIAARTLVGCWEQEQARASSVMQRLNGFVTTREHDEPTQVETLAVVEGTHSSLMPEAPPWARSNLSLVERWRFLRGLKTALCVLMTEK